MRSFLEKYPYDFVTSDFLLSHITVFEALSILKEYGSDIPFFVISNAISNEDTISLMKAGAADFILKDHLPKLIPTIERGNQKAIE